MNQQKERDHLSKHQPTPHITSYSRLFFVFLALLGLTAVTIGVASIDLGILNTWVALAIAATKASLVTLFFMHLKTENLVIRASFIATLIFLAIIIGFVFWDVAFR